VRPCPAHGRWKVIAEQVADFFARTTVAELLELAGDHPAGEAPGLRMKKTSRRTHDELARAK
jgi:hypothetical protein